MKDTDEIKVSYIEAPGEFTGLALIIGPIRIIESDNDLKVISYQETLPYNDKAEVRARVGELLVNKALLYPALPLGWKEYEG